MRRSLAHALPAVLSLVLLFFFTDALHAYTIYLTDGSKIIARQKYEIQEGQAIIILQNGTRVSYDASEIDVERTHRANEQELGTAEVVEQGDVVGVPQNIAPSAPKQTLADLIARRKAKPRALPESRRENTAPESSSLPRTAAGFPDFAALERRTYSPVEILSQLQQAMRRGGIERVAIYQGTAADHPLVEVVVNSEASVFRALLLGANALSDVRTDHAKEVAALELLMLTPSGARAGQFVLTPDDALALLSRRVDVTTFFVDNVQF